ncbi:uncharacterized protein LOC107269530 [Cephus cinctus]|uniref:Uncharacterized protein LOC107269530 n=1 Tax=Cephus cinctus TaxID=211228 RepID=A0AAJ7FMD5_CEPCN|nr:uncharacterized protein LOC107269530 [Cephus cinctus]
MGKEIEEVTKYKYLGYVVRADGDQRDHVEERVEKAAKAMGQVWGIGKWRFRNDWSRRLWLFDKLVWPVVSYGVEIWGWVGRETVERLHERYVHEMGASGVEEGARLYVQLYFDCTVVELKDIAIAGLKERLIKTQEDYIKQTKMLNSYRNKLEFSTKSKPEAPSSLQKENELLNKLVTEMNDKNDLLIEKNENLKEQINNVNMNSSAPLFSTIAAGPKIATKHNFSQRSNVIIRPTNLQNTENVKNEVMSKVNPTDISAKIITIREKKDASFQNNPKKLWNIINDLSKTNKEARTVKVMLDESQKEITDNKSIANNLNSFFASVGSKLAENIAHSNFSSGEVYGILNNLKTNKSTGPDGISPMALKAAADLLASPIAELINKIFESRNVTQQKMLLVNCLNRYIRVWVREKKCLPGSSNELIKSYLENRKQRVKVNGTLSDLSNVTYGVPQGTILGPLLFILYLNDVFDISSKGHLIAYADDTTIIYSASTWKELKSLVSRDLVGTFGWFNDNYLTVNFDKTCFTPFGYYSNSLPEYTQLQVTLIRDNEERLAMINRKDNFKFLGIVLDGNPKWKEQLNNLTARLRRTLFLLRKIKYIVSQDNILSVYHALFHSILCYGIIGWGSAYNNELSAIQILQNKALKVVFSKDTRYNTKALYNESGIPSVNEIFIVSSVKVAPKYLCHIGREYQTVTRSITVENLEAPNLLTTTAQKSFIYIGCQVYNQLGQEWKKMDWIKNKEKKRKLLQHLRNINNIQLLPSKC